MARRRSRSLRCHVIIPPTPLLGVTIIVTERLRLDSPNDNDFQQLAEVCCPHGCPTVEVDGDLARIVVAWPRMTGGQKRGLVEFASSE